MKQIWNIRPVGYKHEISRDHDKLRNRIRNIPEGKIIAFIEVPQKEQNIKVP